MSDIRQWLDSLGLGQYADAFEASVIDSDVLSELDHDVLKEIGVAATGDRLRILKAARALVDGNLVMGRGESRPSTAQAQHHPGGMAERRHLTVMFCDLVGSTELSQTLDPEDLRDLMRAFQDRCAGAVSRFDGFVARYMGDGLLVYFGYPRALEDAPERSVRAGLEVVSAMDGLRREFGDASRTTLAVRVGIATGTVVVGDIVGEGASAESAVVGETPNLAARLQGEAQPDQVVITDATRRLLGDRFQLVDLGSRDLKGIAKPARLWGVDGELTSRPMHVGAGSGPVVGREEELAVLSRAWDATRHGQGQVVLLSGEPGIGKSRLVESLRERIAGDPFVWTSIRCSPHHTQSAFFPVIQQLQRAIGALATDAAGMLESLEDVLQGCGLDASEAVPLIAELLSLPIPEGRYRAVSLSPQQKRRVTLDAIAGWLFDEASRLPVLQIWEDVHWADPSTLELLDLIVEQSPTAAVLNVVTFRPEFDPPSWQRRSWVSSIAPSRLDPREIFQIIDRYASGKQVPPEVVAHVTEKSDGVPLFVEELSKSMLASTALVERADRFELSGSLETTAIPETLQDSLLSRLDRVPRAREVAQIGAVIGREFSFEMLEMLTDLDAGALREALGLLLSEELVHQRGRPPRARYFFKHALIQDAAYGSLLRRTRRALHQRLAETMESRFADLASAQPELVAHHYTEAAVPAKALPYWKDAATRALARFANREAASLLYQALRLVESMPHDRARDREELELQTALGPALWASHSPADPAVEATYTRLIDLCESLEDVPRACLAIRGRQNYHLMRGEVASSLALAEQLASYAGRVTDSRFKIGACHALGQTFFFAGDFRRAREVRDRGIALFERTPAALADWAGGQPGEQCLAYGGMTSWILGYPDTALLQIEKALKAAKAATSTVSLTNTVVFVAFVHAFRRDAKATCEHADAGIALSEQYGFPVFDAVLRVVRACTTATNVPDSSGRLLLEARQGIDRYRSAGMLAWLGMLLGLYSEAALGSGNVSEARTALDEAMDCISSTQEQFWIAELTRLEAELLIADDAPRFDEAETHLRSALDTARRQGARMLELRICTSLARLWRDLGRQEEARMLLAPVHEWFTEGSDCADLRESAELLDVLC